MLIPEHKLAEIDYYEYNPCVTIQKYNSLGISQDHFVSELTVYWRRDALKIWKPRKHTFRIDFCKIKEPNIYDVSPEMEELATQLKIWSKDSIRTLENSIFKNMWKVKPSKKPKTL